MIRKIYLDNQATTPVNKAVVKAMKPYWYKNFGNPSSITRIGLLSRRALNQARNVVAKVLARRANEIVFTGSGTESNNLAIFGVLNFLQKQNLIIADCHFLTTEIEHSSVLECFKEIERRGGQVTYLPVLSSGLIDLKELRKNLKSNTVLVSIGYANNEIGVIQPIREIAKEIRFARKNNKFENLGQYPYFHTDASQAGLYLDLNINQLGVDLLTLDGQKINGPKGVGVLFVSSGLNLSPIILGGGQENGWRSGTENLPLIIGLAKALELARHNFSFQAQKVAKVRDYFWLRLKTEFPSLVLNGGIENRLPNNLNISWPGQDSEFLVLRLDERGIVCSTKSACNHDAEESFVVQALGGSNEIVRSAVRFSLSPSTSKRDIDYVIKVLKKLI